MAALEFRAADLDQLSLQFGDEVGRSELASLFGMENLWFLVSPEGEF